jgi:hypothetical protein
LQTKEAPVGATTSRRHTARLGAEMKPNKPSGKRTEQSRTRGRRDLRERGGDSTHTPVDLRVPFGVNVGARVARLTTVVSPSLCTCRAHTQVAVACQGCTAWPHHHALRQTNATCRIEKHEWKRESKGLAAKCHTHQRVACARIVAAARKRGWQPRDVRGAGVRWCGREGVRV